MTYSNSKNKKRNTKDAHIAECAASPRTTETIKNTTEEFTHHPAALNKLASQIKVWARELGFTQVGIADLDLSKQAPAYQTWLDKHYHGNMDYMARNIDLRFEPDKLHPDTASIICVGLDYLPENAQFAATLDNTDKAYISRYAIGRDYHKVLRNKLKQLGEKIQIETELNIGFRPFVDSAPVLERPLAEKAGIGWTGKHSLILNETAGSWFFLGELFINLALPVDSPVTEKCGQCVACITICPTNAIVAPYEVDARKCISYLTIENKASIPIEYRAAIGNRIYGCDDCQLVCPWNRYADLSQVADFKQRNGLLNQDLLNLWQWDEATFLFNTQGSPIRRIGYQSWLRNLAIGLGNAPYNQAIISALQHKLEDANEMVAEHIHWAIEQQNIKSNQALHSSLASTPISKKNQRLIRVIEKGLPRDA